MKKVTYSFAIVAAVLAGSAASGRAADSADRIYFNADAGGILQQSATFVENGYSSTAEFNLGARVGITTGYNLTDSLAAEFETGILWNSVDTLSGFSLNQFNESIDLYSVPVLAKLVYRFPCGHGWTPYVGVGAGGIVGFFDGTTPLANYHATDVTFAYQAEAGVKYALSDSSSIGIGYKFMGTTDQDYSFGRHFYTDRITFQGVYIHAIFVNFTWNF